MEKSSWGCTLLIQLFLCIAIYGALHLGQPHSFLSQPPPSIHPNPFKHLYFISVSGAAFVPSLHHSRLLSLMVTVAKAYHVKFVVNIGGDDPLFLNATQLSSSMNIPWYTTGASKGKGFGCFMEHIKLPQGKSMDIVFVDTASLEDTLFMGSSSGIGNSQLNCLTRTLRATYGDWRIVVGSQSKEQRETKQVTELFYKILTEFGVNVYLSKEGCTDSGGQDSVACIGIPGSIEREHYMVPWSQVSAIKRETADGFLLHRVSSLEFVTYFINSSGQVIDTSLVKQRGRAVM